MDLTILREIEEYAALGFYEAEALGLPAPRTYGLALRRLYENMPVRVHEQILLTPFEPYYACRKSYGDAMNDARSSDGKDGSHHGVSYILNPFNSSGMEIVAGHINIAEEKKQKYPQHAAFIDALVADLKTKLQPHYGYVHSCPDILQVLRKGFNHYKRLIADGLAAAKTENDETGLQFLLCMQDFAAGIDAFHKTVTQALTQAAQAATGARAEQLALLRDEFAGCFYEPAQSFIGGLLTVNLLFMLDGCDSLGRLDYALGDLFEQDLASGKLSLPLARSLLENLWEAFEAHNGWNMQLGGRTPEGGQCYNALTRECLRCDARRMARRPNLALRVTKDMPDDILELALDSILRGTGTPALYNDEAYMDNLRALFPELTEADAALYGFGGCSETMIPGLSCCDSLGWCSNLAHTVNCALHDKARGLANCATFEELMNSVQQHIDENIKKITTQVYADLEQNMTAKDPKIARSMFTRDCLENRRGFEAGGARYNWAVGSYSGTTVAIDSLFAIKHLVYETGAVSRERLLAALKTDFAQDEELRGMLLRAPKFGNDHAAADALGAELLGYTWNAALQYRTPRGGRFLPSIILFQTYAHEGSYVTATANGRHAGQPLNDSVGAFEGADTNGPTALINSVLKLPQHLASGTPIFNLRFQKSLACDPAGRAGLKSLIRTYFAGGGLQMQISVLSNEEMREAQKHPEKYQDLIVRIGGYSEYFVYLSPELQETVLRRGNDPAKA
ncbi:MAG: hypothetical protein LBC83_07525 [Oscillospiraceae bacterium]|jgi:formate C-acetyltransferase|nr:hypothetical protein [Oscillospiraceae bacterium]